MYNVVLFRREVGSYIPLSSFYSGVNQIVKIGTKGQPDLYGYLLFKDKPGQSLEIEVKSSKGDRLRPEQIDYKNFCIKNNIHYYTAMDIDKTVSWLKSLQN